jgi:hypothetical protein
MTGLLLAATAALVLIVLLAGSIGAGLDDGFSLGRGQGGNVGKELPRSGLKTNRQPESR